MAEKKKTLKFELKQSSHAQNLVELLAQEEEQMVRRFNSEAKPPYFLTKRAYCFMSKKPLFKFMLDSLLAVTGLYKMKRVELVEKMNRGVVFDDFMDSEVRAMA